jgi:hypothetical protein
MLISILLFFGLQISVFSQNRICEWETEKISAITVEFTATAHLKEMTTFDKRSEIDKIMTFLKNVDFRVLNSSNRDSLDIKNDKEYRISFKGQRDQVYLRTHSACIGKTSFLINPDVTMNFSALIRELNTN